MLETTRSGPDGTQRTTQTITRSHDRVRLALDGGRQEWLFLQNVIYRDRAAAYSSITIAAKSVSTRRVHCAA